MGHVPDDNIVEFPTTQENNEAPSMEQTVEEKPPLTPEQIAQLEEKGATQVLTLIDKNRAYGVKQLQNSVDQQEGRGMLDPSLMPGLENIVRALEKGIGGALTSMEAINSLIDMIRHDMVAMIQNLQQIQQAAVINNTQVNVLLQLLDKKGVITEDEMQETFRDYAKNQMDRENK